MVVKASPGGFQATLPDFYCFTAFEGVEKTPGKQRG
jgi:hypothetical protein